MFRKEYQYYHDVIIMSSKGSRPACSILSGGDYDGKFDPGVLDNSC